MIDFNKCTDKAYEILLEQKGEIPVDVASLLLNEPIIFDTLQNYAKLTKTTKEHLTINHKIENGFVIPESVTNMQATFGGCKNLAITITLKSNQATYNNNTFKTICKQVKQNFFLKITKFFLLILTA